MWLWSMLLMNSAIAHDQALMIAPGARPPFRSKLSLVCGSFASSTARTTAVATRCQCHYCNVLRASVSITLTYDHAPASSREPLQQPHVLGMPCVGVLALAVPLHAKGL